MIKMAKTMNLKVKKHPIKKYKSMRKGRRAGLLDAVR